MDQEPFVPQHRFKNELSSWTCPICRRGSLRLVEESLREKITVASAAAYEYTSDESDLKGQFIAMLTCQNQDCGETSVLAGTTIVVDITERYAEHQEFATKYRPRYFCPSPLIIEIPENCPDEVRTRLTTSFTLYWNDPGACANAVRSAVEAFLTAQGVARYNRAKGKNLARISLHHRIERYQKVNKERGDSLMAVKWIGNAGSHDDELDEEALLLGYKILEHVLIETYEQRTKRLMETVLRINRLKTPPPPPKVRLPKRL